MSLTPIVWRSSWAPRQCPWLMWWTSTCESHSSRRRCDHAGHMESPADMIAGGTTRRGAAITLSERKSTPAPLATSMATDTLLALPRGGYHPKCTQARLTNDRGKHHKKVCVKWFKWVSDSSSKGEMKEKWVVSWYIHKPMVCLWREWNIQMMMRTRFHLSCQQPPKLFLRKLQAMRLKSCVCINIFVNVYAPVKWLTPMPRVVPSEDNMLHQR